MTEYTPTADEIRGVYVFTRSATTPKERLAAFNRWLTRHDQDISEAAYYKAKLERTTMTPMTDHETGLNSEIIAGHLADTAAALAAMFKRYREDTAPEPHEDLDAYLEDCRRERELHAYLGGHHCEPGPCTDPDVTPRVTPKASYREDVIGHVESIEIGSIDVHYIPHENVVTVTVDHGWDSPPLTAVLDAQGVEKLVGILTEARLAMEADQ